MKKGLADFFINGRMMLSRHAFSLHNPL